MTDPTTVTIAAVNADSTPAAFAQVIARLIHGGAGGTINDVAIVDEVAVRLDEDGEGTVALYPNDVIVPAGTYWSLTVKGSTPTVVRLLDVPESATPVSWTDPAYLLEDPSPPTVVPAPTSGVAFQVPRVNSTGDTYELRTLVPADISGLPAALDAKANESTVGFGTTYGTYAPLLGVPAADTADVVAVLASATTIEALHAIILGLARNLSAPVTQGREDAEGAMVLATDGPLTGDLFDLCADFDTEEHDDRTYSTDPIAFTGGAYVEARIQIDESRLPAAPTDGDTVYMELFTNPGDDIGNFDLLEPAIESTYSATLGRWRHFLFLEGTRVGETVESFQISDGGINTAGGRREVIPGVPVRVAFVLQSDNGDGVYRASLWREVPFGTHDATWDGKLWRLAANQVGTTTLYLESGARPWRIGAGHGRILTDEIIIRDGGPTGTILARPTAALAAAAGEGVAFDDAYGNTWTPAAGATLENIPAPSGGGGAVDSVNGDTGVVVLTAADVGAAATSHSHAASDITSGTIAAARLPTFPWPRRQTIHYAVHKPMSFTTWTPTSGSFIGGGFASGTNANSESWTYGLSLDAGTYTARSVARRSTQGPIISFALDGGVGTIGTHDTYNGSTAGDNAVDLSTTLVIPTAGYYTLTITNATRNGSNVTGWVMTPQVFDLYRTGP